MGYIRAGGGGWGMERLQQPSCLPAPLLGSLYVPYGSGPTCFVFGSDLCLSDISWPSDITTGGRGIN